MQAEQPERYAELRATAELFPSAMQDSELGDIPEGWGVAPIGQLCDVRKGLSYKGKHVVDDETQFPMINLGNFGGAGAFKAEKLKRYDGDHKPRHMVSAGQLMVANTDMTQNRVILGSPIIVPDVGTTILFTHHTFAVDFKPEYPAAEWRNYIFHWCLQPSFRGRAEGFATGTTVLALPKDAFLKCDIVVAPHNVVGTFNSKAQSIIAEQDSLNAQNSSLEELRNTLLPKLLSGELTLPDTKETQTELQDVADV
jgi:type I restriction enzyme S subunit